MYKLHIKMKNYIILLTLNLFFTYSTFADKQDTSIAEAHYNQEKQIIDQPFTISFYEPTYILPISYSTAYNSTYIKSNPDKKQLKRF